MAEPWQIQVSGSPVFSVVSNLPELLSENMDNMMNKTEKIMSSVISWERLPEKEHCDLGFQLSWDDYPISKVGLSILVSADFCEMKINRWKWMCF